MHYDVAMMLAQDFNVDISDSAAQLLFDESISKMEEGRRTEINDLVKVINKRPSPYLKPFKQNEGMGKFITQSSNTI